ncbi:MAG: hypothetical protein FWE88_04910 [Phycisphaerae bacterium]|nr:hypothetical protein [Phycisphaerae bacterium]
MKPVIWTFIAMLIPVAILAGCADVNITSRRSTPPPAELRDDGRPIADIRAENARLRARQADLEDAWQKWQIAVAREEQNKKDLKSQRDRAEKDLKTAKDQAKKRAKGKS